MSDLVTFIIPNRDGKDLDKVIQNINTVYSDMTKEIIVVEQCDTNPFMRGQLFNIGVRFAHGKYLALSDNDIYHLRKVPWIEIYETVKQPIIGFKYISQVTLQDGKPIITSTENCEVGFGGFNFLSKDDFIEANGFSNLMIGWGAEDNEFFHRFPNYIRVPQNLGHLTHPRRVNANPKNTELNRDVWYNHRTNKNDDGFRETTFNLISSKVEENVTYLKVDSISVVDGFKFKLLLERHFKQVTPQRTNMKILVTSMWFDGFGGSEAWCYAVISELLRRGHSVDVYAPVLGKMYKELEAIGVKCVTEGCYDLILDNHSPKYTSFVGPIIHTCHGIIDRLDRPMANAFNVAVSKKIGEHHNVTTIIPNGIDTNRFYCKKPVHSEIQKVLSLCKTDTANAVLRQICSDVGVEFESMYGKEVFHVEDKINEADLVVGVGRSLLDAMACERPVVSFDDRFYFTTRMMGHGYITPDKYKYQAIDNFTGSSLRKTLRKVDLAKEIFEKYNPDDGKLHRKYILDNLSVEQTVNRYLELYNNIYVRK